MPSTKFLFFVLFVPCLFTTIHGVAQMIMVSCNKGLHTHRRPGFLAFCSHRTAHAYMRAGLLAFHFCRAPEVTTPRLTIHTDSLLGEHGDQGLQRESRQRHFVFFLSSPCPGFQPRISLLWAEGAEHYTFLIILFLLFFLFPPASYDTDFPLPLYFILVKSLFFLFF